MDLNMGGGSCFDSSSNAGVAIFKSTIPRNATSYIKLGSDEEGEIERQVYKGELSTNAATKEHSDENSLAAQWLRNEVSVSDGVFGTSPVLMSNNRQILLTFTDGSTAIVPKPSGVKSQANLN
jgi:hypothetical protein